MSMYVLSNSVMSMSTNGRENVFLRHVSRESLG